VRLVPRAAQQDDRSARDDARYYRAREAKSPGLESMVGGHHGHYVVVPVATILLATILVLILL
jgi:hypothetical protein